ncbi:MAG: cellulase family glycosylhydrolase [Chloroflexi bacterium]|nr:cellulase family glycosylhydrolase [Chloroflexota bacterium]
MATHSPALGPGRLCLAAAATLGLAFLVLLTAGGSVDTLTTDARHRALALGALPAAFNPGAQAPDLGVNVFLEQEVEPAKRRATLRAVKDAGATYIRQQIPWEQIEPVAKGSFVDRVIGVDTWQKFDDIMVAAEEAGLRVLLRLDTSPPWALTPGAPDGLGPPLRNEDFWDYVELVARRYRGRVAAYQVWNEPNLMIEWGQRPPDPVAYAALLRGAADRIRAADPGVPVVLAALAPTLTDDAQARTELRYLQQLYDAGARNSFDVAAVQAYGLRGGPDDPRTGSEDVTFSRASLVYEVMRRNGDGAKPVWATEAGWNAAPEALQPNPYGRVSSTLQARYTLRALERVRTEWPWLRQVYVWFFKRADDSEQGQAWYWFSLADARFQVRPVYRALVDRASGMAAP